MTDSERFLRGWLVWAAVVSMEGAASGLGLTVLSGLFFAATLGAMAATFVVAR